MIEENNFKIEFPEDFLVVKSESVNSNNIKIPNNLSLIKIKFYKYCHKTKKKPTYFIKNRT